MGYGLWVWVWRTSKEKQVKISVSYFDTSQSKVSQDRRRGYLKLPYSNTRTLGKARSKVGYLT